MSAPRYEIKQLADFLTVPTERRKECLREFGVWLDMHDDINSLLGNMPGQPVVARWSGVFSWVDDNKGEFKITIHPVESLDGVQS